MQGDSSKLRQPLEKLLCQGFDVAAVTLEQLKVVQPMEAVRVDHQPAVVRQVQRLQALQVLKELLVDLLDVPQAEALIGQTPPWSLS